MKGEIIDPRIVPGALIRLNQRVKYVPLSTRLRPGFDIQNTNVPVWLPIAEGGKLPYEAVPSGSVAHVIRRYVDSKVIKLEVLMNEKLYRCYGIHADLLE
jgi:hypothetical protein